jgi:glycosyltransferase involved in cell wall biosynthesis
MGKILLFCPVYEPYAGGGGQYFPLLSKNLADLSRISRIFVFTEWHTDRPLVEKRNKIVILRIFPKRDNAENLSKPMSILNYLVTNLLIIFCVLVFGWKSNVIITRYHWPLVLFVLPWLRSWLRFKTFFDLRAVLENVNYLRQIKQADAVFCNALAVKSQADKYIKSNLPKIHIVNPIDLPKVKNVNKSVYNNQNLRSWEKKKFVLFCGNIHPRKSPLELIRAFLVFEQLVAEDVYLVFVGKNHMGSEFTKLEQSNEKIVFLGAQTRNDCLKLMNLSQIVALPSKIEGIPRTCLEALSLKKKVLLPACVDEFLVSDKAFCATDLSPDVMGMQLYKIFESSILPTYKVQQHELRNFKSNYEPLFSRLR